MNKEVDLWNLWEREGGGGDGGASATCRTTTLPTGLGFTN